MLSLDQVGERGRPGFAWPGEVIEPPFHRCSSSLVSGAVVIAGGAISPPGSGPPCGWIRIQREFVEKVRCMWKRIRVFEQLRVGL